PAQLRSIKRLPESWERAARARRRYSPRPGTSEAADGRAGLIDRGVQLAQRHRRDLPACLGEGATERVQAVRDLTLRSGGLPPHADHLRQLPGNGLRLLGELPARCLRDVGGPVDQALQLAQPAGGALQPGLQLTPAGATGLDTRVV